MAMCLIHSTVPKSRRKVTTITNISKTFLKKYFCEIRCLLKKINLLIPNTLCPPRSEGTVGPFRTVYYIYRSVVLYIGASQATMPETKMGGEA